jgi:hypothetical protein
LKDVERKQKDFQGTLEKLLNDRISVVKRMVDSLAEHILKVNNEF